MPFPIQTLPPTEFKELTPNDAETVLTHLANTWTYLDSELQADSFLTVQFSLSQLVLQAKGNKPSTSLRRRLRGLWKL